ncbi:MAG: hypothetical protein C4346_19625 [Chloroflexota bacterium]
MQLPSPNATVASALHHAAIVALPAIAYQRRDLSAMQGWSADKRMEAMRAETVPMKNVMRRPADTECQVYAMFPQTWGSTALGFGGIGGAAMTSAYTVIIEGPEGHLAVYWNASLAYLIDQRKQTDAQRRALQADLANRHTANRMEAVVNYGAIPGNIDA